MKDSKFPALEGLVRPAGGMLIGPGGRALPFRGSAREGASGWPWLEVRNP